MERRWDPGIFRIFMGTSPEQGQSGLQAVLEQVERLRQEPVGTRELRRAQGYAAGMQSIAQQRKNSVALQLAFHELVGHGYRGWRQAAQLMKAVTAEQILEAARAYLDPARAACVVVLPRGFRTPSRTRSGDS